ncbi:6-hydroxymethylpterin diphosphokinase MptE-like protein [Halorubellus sp. PRR65]|uniref:6-hydroxymethylpterin diphosphokinase MptE-like protein n=1 Tax=Halorubellus sp. PRR65 TaxID=3098148 RepID=UPI002B256AF6|nr:6-hydroxymethylpterin diphosphokinase MptE-like protein [Halorubellus sp. PRR65]
MDFETFEPAYEAVLADFGFDRASDERARDVLAGLDPGGSLAAFEAALGGRDVAVVAPGPSLVDDLDAVAAVADAPDGAVLAVSSAAPVLREHGVAVDAYVTDLDATPELAPTLTDAGVPSAVHAHGDNVPAVREVVPECDREHVLGTTQAAPRPAAGVVNVGGFTDGDRAAFLADHVGARSLAFPGWDLDDPDVDPMKARKLAWARRLLALLERDRFDRQDRLDDARYEARFDVLDGHRDDVDHSFATA